MAYTGNSHSGIERLVAKYRQEFQITENLNHYSFEDYQRAERTYVCYRLRNGHPFENRAIE